MPAEGVWVDLCTGVPTSSQEPSPLTFSGRAPYFMVGRFLVGPLKWHLIHCDPVPGPGCRSQSFLSTLGFGLFL